MDTLSRKLSTPKAERPPRHHSRPISLLHKLASGGGAGGGGGDAGGGGSPGGTPAAAAGGGGDAAAQGGEDGLGGELEEGQVGAGRLGAACRAVERWTPQLQVQRAAAYLRPLTLRFARCCLADLLPVAPPSAPPVLPHAL